MMKKRNIQILIILIALGISLVFSSVGNAMDIDERTLVHAIGIDLKDGKYDVSMQVFKTGGSGSDTPIDVSQSNMCVVKSSGKTVSEALDIAQNEKFLWGIYSLLYLVKRLIFQSRRTFLHFA